VGAQSRRPRPPDQARRARRRVPPAGAYHLRRRLGFSREAFSAEAKARRRRGDPPENGGGKRLVSKEPHSVRSSRGSSVHKGRSGSVLARRISLGQRLAVHRSPFLETSSVRSCVVRPLQGVRHRSKPLDQQRVLSSNDPRARWAPAARQRGSWFPCAARAGVEESNHRDVGGRR